MEPATTRRRTWRKLRHGHALAILALVSALLSPLAATSQTTAAEDQITQALTMINTYRSWLGLPPMQRTKELRILSDQKRIDFMKEQKGKILTVIPESKIENSNIWRGWTENYVRVHFESSEDVFSKFVNVKIDSASGDYAFAELI